MAESQRIPLTVALPPIPKTPEQCPAWAERLTAALARHFLRLGQATATGIAGAAGGSGAPTTTEYVVAVADAGLSAERVATDTATIDVDMGTAAQAKWHAVGLRVTGPVDLVAGAVADGQFLKRSGATLIGDTPAGGSGTFGTTTIDFGAFPGKSDASVAVTGQATIVAGSKVNAWLRLVDSADHTADEHWVESLRVFAGGIVAGTGFTIYARNDNPINEPLFPSAAQPAVAVAAAAITTEDSDEGGRSPLAGVGGIGTRIYGVWNVQWIWA